MRYSEKEAYNGCPTRYRFTHVDGLKRATSSKSENAKDWGAAIHAGLEAHYQMKTASEAIKAFKELYPADLDPDDMARNTASGEEVLRRYVEHYAVKDMDWEVLSTEHEDQIEIGGDQHGLHIDLIAKHKPSGEIFFWDHKTTSKEASPTYWKGYELSGQVTRYTSYVKEKFGQCGGCYINNIQVKHLKKKNKYGEGPGLVIKFERQLFNRTPQQIEYWRESDEAWMKMIEFSKQSGVWGKALNGLCAWCEFYDLCLASNDEQIREALYSDQPLPNFEVQ